MYCQKCGNKLDEKWVKCPYCGTDISKEITMVSPGDTHNANETSNDSKESNGKKMAEKNKWVSFLLCLFLGYFGAHKVSAQ